MDQLKQRTELLEKGKSTLLSNFSNRYGGEDLNGEYSFYFQNFLSCSPSIPLITDVLWT